VVKSNKYLDTRLGRLSAGTRLAACLKRDRPEKCEVTFGYMRNLKG